MTPEEALKRLEASDKLGGVDTDMIPEEGKKNDVIDFIKIHSADSITMEEKDLQTNYFRSITEKSLAHLCPKVSQKSVSEPVPLL